MPLDAPFSKRHIAPHWFEYNRRSPQPFGLTRAYPLLRCTGGTAYDLTGRQHADLENIGAGDWVPGPFGGNILDFNGTDEALTAASHADFNKTDDVFACAWCNFPSFKNVDPILSRWNESIARIWSLSIAGTGGNLEIFTSSDSSFQSGNTATTTTTPLILNTWHHVAMCHDSVAQTNTLFVDGKQEVQTTGVEALLFNSAVALELAHSPTFGGSEKYTPFKAFDFRFYNVLSDPSGVKMARRIFNDPWDLFRERGQRTYHFLVPIVAAVAAAKRRARGGLVVNPGTLLVR